MKKETLAIFVAALFVVGVISPVMGSMELATEEIKARKLIEDRPIIPILTEKGMDFAVNIPVNGFEAKAKPPSPPGKPDEPDPNPEPGTGDGVVRKWALCIGISDYDGTANDLNYCDDDAMDWKNFLNGQGYNVVTLLDRSATANAIEAKIDELLANEDGDDYVVFTYSGHGTTYRNYGSCMISTDMWYITHGWLESKFGSADSPHIYFAFDACKIGGFKGVVTDGRVGAFASDKDYSYDGDSTMKNGVFTYYQMEGWDTYNNFEDDSAYAVQGMEAWASQYVNVNVDPFYVDKYTGDMIP